MTPDGDRARGDAVAASAWSVRRSSQELADDVARTSERLAALLHARADGQADPQRAGELRRAAARAEEFAREERAAARHWRSRYRHSRQ